MFLIGLLIFQSLIGAVSPCYRAEFGFTARLGDEPFAWHGLIGDINAGIKAGVIKTMLGASYGTSPFYKKELLPPTIYPPYWEEKESPVKNLYMVILKSEKKRGQN